MAAELQYMQVEELTHNIDSNKCLTDSRKAVDMDFESDPVCSVEFVTNMSNGKTQSDQDKQQTIRHLENTNTSSILFSLLSGQENAGKVRLRSLLFLRSPKEVKTQSFIRMHDTRRKPLQPIRNRSTEQILTNGHNSFKCDRDQIYTGLNNLEKQSEDLGLSKPLNGILKNRMRTVNLNRPMKTNFSSRRITKTQSKKTSHRRDNIKQQHFNHIYENPWDILRLTGVDQPLDLSNPKYIDKVQNPINVDQDFDLPTVQYSDNKLPIYGPHKHLNSTDTNLIETYLLNQTSNMFQPIYVAAIFAAIAALNESANGQLTFAEKAAQFLNTSPKYNIHTIMCLLSTLYGNQFLSNNTISSLTHSSKCKLPSDQFDCTRSLDTSNHQSSEGNSYSPIRYDDRSEVDTSYLINKNTSMEFKHRKHTTYSHPNHLVPILKSYISRLSRLLYNPGEIFISSVQHLHNVQGELVKNIPFDLLVKQEFIHYLSSNVLQFMKQTLNERRQLIKVNWHRMLPIHAYPNGLDVIRDQMQVSKRTSKSVKTNLIRDRLEKYFSEFCDELKSIELDEPSLALIMVYFVNLDEQHCNQSEQLENILLHHAIKTSRLTSSNFSDNQQEYFVAKLKRVMRFLFNVEQSSMQALISNGSIENFDLIIDKL